MATLALIAVPAAIFRRRSKDEWLGELGEIREDALGLPGDEIGAAMTTTPPAQEGSPPPGVAEATDPAVVAPASPFETAAPPLTTLPGGGSPSISRAPRPAPHRDRPGELWHAPLDVEASSLAGEIGPEERIGSAELVDNEGRGLSGVEIAASVVGEVPADPTGHSDAAPPTEVPMDIVEARDLQEPVFPRVERDPEARPRLRPPTDIFDVAPAMPPEPFDTGGATHTGGLGTSTARPDDRGGRSGLVAEPVGRRPTRAQSSRSLFGGGAGAPPQQRPVHEKVEIADNGEVLDDRGTLRFAEKARPEIIRSPSDDSLTLDAGWCWVSRATSVPPARISTPHAVLVVPAAAKALVVVEGDESTFISVVDGSAHLEHESGLVPLVAGSICHVPPDGAVEVDVASAEEMASDAILSRNLRMDDALDAITALRSEAHGA